MLRIYRERQTTCWKLEAICLAVTLARDLGVVIDSKLSLAARGGPLPVWFLPPVSTPSSARITNT